MEDVWKAVGQSWFLDIQLSNHNETHRASACWTGSDIRSQIRAGWFISVDAVMRSLEFETANT